MGRHREVNGMRGILRYLLSFSINVEPEWYAWLFVGFILTVMNRSVREPCP